MCKKAFVLVCVLLFVMTFKIPIHADTRQKISLLLTENEGIFVLSVKLSKGAALCGLELDVEYNKDVLSLCSAERAEGLSSLDFACSLKPYEGKARLIFWGADNSDTSGTLVNISFVRKNTDAAGKCEFKLSLPTQTSALCFEGNKLLPIKIELDSLSLYLGTEKDTEGDLPTESPTRAEEESSPASVTETVTETDTETVSETETQFPYVPPTTLGEPTGIGVHDKTRDLQKATDTVLKIYLSAATLLSIVSILFLLFPKLLRKGYF